MAIVHPTTDAAAASDANRPERRLSHRAVYFQLDKPVSVSELEREHLTVKWPPVTVEN